MPFIERYLISDLDFIRTSSTWVAVMGQMSRMFANGTGDGGSIPGRVIPKTKKNGTWCCIA